MDQSRSADRIAALDQNDVGIHYLLRCQRLFNKGDSHLSFEEN